MIFLVIPIAFGVFFLFRCRVSHFSKVVPCSSQSYRSTAPQRGQTERKSCWNWNEWMVLRKFQCCIPADSFSMVISEIKYTYLSRLGKWAPFICIIVQIVFKEWIVGHREDWPDSWEKTQARIWEMPSSCKNMYFFLRRLRKLHFWRFSSQAFEETDHIQLSRATWS